MTYVSEIMIVLIFVTAIVGLYAVNGLNPAESYSNTSDPEITDTFSQNEIVRVFSQTDASIMSFFDDLRDTYAFLVEMEIFKNF